MSRHSIPENQDALWSSEELQTVPQEVPVGPIIPEGDAPEPGPAYTDVAERAQGLSQLMAIFNDESHVRGLDRTANSSRRAELERRYGADTDTVVQRAKERVRSEKDLQVELVARATGIKALEASGFIDAQEATDQAELLLVKLRHTYGPRKSSAKQRNDFAHSVQNAADIITGSKPVPRKKHV